MILSSSPETDAKSPQTTQAPTNQKVCVTDEDNDELNLIDPTEAEIVKYIAGFERVRVKLEDYIDPWNKLHSCFVDFDIMTPDEADEIDCRKPSATRVLVTKMKEFLKSGSQKCIPMLKALVVNDQTHIANFIVNFDKATKSFDRVLTEGERKAIIQNMFCLEKLIRPHIDEFLYELVEVGCITENHQKWVIETTETKKHVNELFEILKRRSFKHFNDFREWLQEAGHENIVDVLTKGGVVEITNHLKGIEVLSKQEKETIEKGIINKLCSYVDDENENKLNKEQRSFIDKLIALLNKNKIKFIRGFPTNSIAMHFQCETEVSKDWLVNFCENGGLKAELEDLYRILQPELTGFPKFYIAVSVTNSSPTHSINTTFRGDSGD